MSELILWDKMKQAVVECHDIDEISNIRNQAEAYRYALRQAKESPEVIRKAEEIKLRAERRAGELLKETDFQQGSRGYGKKVESHPVTPLSELGVTKNQSSNWQKIANIPEEKFENYIEVQKELSTNGALKIAKQILREEEINKIKGKIENKELVAPDGLFDVIVIDPPWNYGGNYNPDGRRVSSPYPEMALD